MVIKKSENNFIVGSGVYLTTNLLNALIPFILLPVLTRVLSPGEYGQVAMFQTLIGLFAAFVGLSVPAAASRKFYDSNHGADQLKEFLGACLHILCMSTVLTLFFVYVSSEALVNWLGVTEDWLLLAVVVSSTTFVMKLYLGQLQVRGMALRYGLMQVAQSFLNFSMSIILVVYLLEGANGRINAVVLSSLIFSFLSIYFLRAQNLINIFVWRPGLFSEILKFGVPLIPHVGGGFLLLTLDRYAIASILGLDQVGVYMVAVQFSMVAALFFDAFNKAYVPWLFERLKSPDEKIKFRIVRLTYAWFFVVILGAFLSFYVGPLLIYIFAGEGYAESGGLVGFLVLGQVFGGMAGMLINYIIFSRKTGILSLITLISGAVNFCLLLAFVKGLGAVGAAYAFCLSMGLKFVLSWYFANKKIPMPWLSRRLFLFGGTGFK